MKSKLVHQDAGEKTYVIVFDTGEEVVKGLLDFAKQHQLVNARFTAIGALRGLTLGYFAWQEKKYEKIPLEEQVEVLSLAGNLVSSPQGPKLHAHIVVGKRDATAHGGHLVEAFVRPTLEVMLIESGSGPIERRHDETTGLALITL